MVWKLELVLFINIFICRESLRSKTENFSWEALGTFTAWNKMVCYSFLKLDLLVLEKHLFGEALLVSLSHTPESN